jgi:hypothetical protein
MEMVDSREELNEYRIHYTIENTTEPCDKYFMAHSVKEARMDFDHICEKKDMKVVVEKMDQWNRWKDVWEVVEDSHT